jgi:dTDP-4-dehydrorhamnose reductase
MEFMKKKILVLGASGMLGSMVYFYFNKVTKHTVAGTVREKTRVKRNKNYLYFDVDKFDSDKKAFNGYRPDYIINCIGVINKYCRDDNPSGVVKAIKINALFPYSLIEDAEKTGAKVIQIATDCVFSGKQGRYVESSPHDAIDAYGKTKSLGEVRGVNFLNIRCSIIGPDRSNKASLLEWFLGHKPGSTVKGYAHHRWNGVTTLQFAQLCHQIVDAGEDHFHSLTGASSVHHYLPNKAVTKYALLQVLNEVFSRKVRIDKVDNIGLPIDRTLSTEYRLLIKRSGYLDQRKAVLELKEFIDKNDFYVN